MYQNIKYYHGDGDYQNNNNNNNNGDDGDDEEEEEMLEICERVYEDSLKCNDHLSLAYYQVCQIPKLLFVLLLLVLLTDIY